MSKIVTHDYTKELAVAKQIAREAGEIMRYYFFATDMCVETKEDSSPVTEADIKINSLVIERLATAFADDGVIGEEQSTATYGTGRRWGCDPIDGTKGFIWGAPTAMFSLGLVVDGTPVLGVCYESIVDELYWAVVERAHF